jgi:hypothetical protein
MLDLAKSYHESLGGEPLDATARALRNVGKVNTKKRLAAAADAAIADNVLQTLGTMIDTIVF